MENGRIIVKSGESEVVVKKSRFLGLAAFASTEQEARDIINSIKKEHYAARHVCYAYIIGEDNPAIKYSDDGEPGGTAGKPILDVIQNSGIHNIVVTVTRYFGGVLLGTGGLVRAYTDAAKEAVNASEKREVCLRRNYDIIIDYAEFDKIKFLIDGIEGTQTEIDYTDKVVIHLNIPDAVAETTVAGITEMTSGRAVINYISSGVS